MGDLNGQANMLFLFVSALIFWIAIDRLVLRRLTARRMRGFRSCLRRRRGDRHQHLQRGFRY